MKAFLKTGHVHLGRHRLLSPDSGAPAEESPEDAKIRDLPPTAN